MCAGHQQLRAAAPVPTGFVVIVAVVAAACVARGLEALEKIVIGEAGGCGWVVEREVYAAATKGQAEGGQRAVGDATAGRGGQVGVACGVACVGRGRNRASCMVCRVHMMRYKEEWMDTEERGAPSQQAGRDAEYHRLMTPRECPW